MVRSRTPKVGRQVARPRPESFESRLDPVAKAAWEAGFAEGAFEVPPGVDTLPVGSGLCALVDADDVDVLMVHRWKVIVFPNGRVEFVSRVGDSAMLHRLLLRPRKPCVDHRNGLVLDNRRSNLREATYAQNAWNSWRPKTELSASQLFGVTRTRGGWLASTQHLGTWFCIGVYETELEAGLAYDQWCLDMRGEFALLNFPSRVQR